MLFHSQAFYFLNYQVLIFRFVHFYKMVLSSYKDRETSVINHPHCEGIFFLIKIAIVDFICIFANKIVRKMYNRIYDNYWNFRTSNTKEYTHCYHTYPAMMIPQVARTLLERYKPTDKTELVFDPYMGSGTTLVEASIIGINSIGTDINPLARLISQVKTTHYDETTILNEINHIQQHYNDFDPEKVESKDFSRISNYSFWYTEDSLLRLSFLSQLINSLSPEIQDFFNVALSETVREVSFTRHGEFKRYRMSEKSLAKFKPDVFSIFDNKLRRNLTGLIEYNQNSLPSSSKICDFNTVYNIPEEIIKPESVDIVVTSPPYGDSHTTVAYGQFSRWANEWFNFPNAKNLDNILMGGKKKSTINIDPQSIRNELLQIKEQNGPRYLEVMSFLEDYANSMKNVARLIRPGGRVCYVVGNRTVKSVQIPLDYFTAEIFEDSGFKHEQTIVREIPNKRMPSKTSPSNKVGESVNTMSNEYIVILKKL